MHRPLAATLVAAVSICAIALPATAEETSPFVAGPAIPDFGPVAAVDIEFPIPADATFHVRFDVSDSSTPGELNRRLVTLARFLNMHAAAGVPEENIALAAVIHGGATKDMTTAEYFGAETDKENANAPLIAALKEKGVRFYVCGQSAAHYGVDNEDLLPGVEMALSAMTAHALLDAEGYTLNPF